MESPTIINERMPRALSAAQKLAEVKRGSGVAAPRGTQSYRVASGGFTAVQRRELGELARYPAGFPVAADEPDPVRFTKEELSRLVAGFADAKASACAVVLPQRAAMPRRTTDRRTERVLLRILHLEVKGVLAAQRVEQ